MYRWGGDKLSGLITTHKPVSVSLSEKITDEKLHFFCDVELDEIINIAVSLIRLSKNEFNISLRYVEKILNDLFFHKTNSTL